MAKFLKKWLKYNLAHTQIRFVLILTVSVFLIILAVSLTSYYTSKAVMQEELSEPQRQMLHLNMNVIDESIVESDQIAVQVALNSHIYHFLTSQNQNSYSRISDIYDFFSTIIENSHYVRSIYVYDMERGSFVSIPQGYSSSKQLFNDSEWIDVADEFGDRMTLIKKRKVPEGAGGKGSSVTLFRKISIQGEFKGIVAVNLKEDELFSKLNPPELNNLNRMRFIIDGNDEILYSTANFDYDEEMVYSALNELKENESGDITHRNQTLLVNQIVSPVTGWKYVSMVEQDSLLAQSKKVRDTVLYVSIAALGLGFATIFYINAAAFRPVRRLKQLFSTYDTQSNEEGVNLERLAGELLSKHAHLSQLVRETMSEAASKMITDIYNGHVTGKREIEEKWKRYFRDWTGSSVTAAIISIDRYEEWSRRFSSSDQSLLKFALVNIVAEMCEPRWRVACADFGQDKTAILLQPRDGASDPKGMLEEAVTVVMKLLKFSVSIGVSHSQAGGPVRLRQSLFEAENALTYRMYEGYGKVILFQDVSEHEEKCCEPDQSKIEELVRWIEAGHETEALKAVTEMIAMAHHRSVYPSTALGYLEKMIDSIEQLETDEAEADEAVYERFDTLHLEDIHLALNDRIVRLVRRYRGLIERKEFLMCHRMIEYMKQHLGEPIGIPEIAESIGISSSLASQVFKQEMGETIYNYLTQLRMEGAAELLLKTDHRISDIASMVGYQHENSFIRSFRKFMDITPGKYRDMMKTRAETILE